MLVQEMLHSACVTEQAKEATSHFSGVAVLLSDMADLPPLLDEAGQESTNERCRQTSIESDVSSATTSQERQEELELVSLASLRELCTEQAEHYYKGNSPSAAAAQELFRRAICGNADAWEVLYEQYKGMVFIWITKKSPCTLPQDEILSMVHEAFARFAVSMTEEKLKQSKGVPQLFSYLRRCAHSVWCDNLRQTRRYASVLPLEEAADQPCAVDMAEMVVARLDATAQLARLLSLLKNRTERIYISALYHEMTPQQIQHTYPDVFRSVDDVHRTRRNIVERVSRNKRQLFPQYRRRD